MWRWWKDKNAIPDISTSPRCWPTHVTSLPTQNEATRFRFLTQMTRRVFLQVSCGESFWLYGQPDRRVEALGAVLRGTRGVAPVVIFVYPSHSCAMFWSEQTETSMQETGQAVERRWLAPVLPGIRRGRAFCGSDGKTRTLFLMLVRPLAAGRPTWPPSRPRMRLPDSDS